MQFTLVLYHPGGGFMAPSLFCQAKLYVALDSKISTEVINFEIIHSIYYIMVVHFRVSIYLKLSSGRYPENDFKTFLTITILEII